MLSEISQPQKNKNYMLSLLCEGVNGRSGKDTGYQSNGRMPEREPGKKTVMSHRGHHRVREIISNSLLHIE